MRQPCSSLRVTHSPRLTTFFLVYAVLESTHLAEIAVHSGGHRPLCLDTRPTTKIAAPVTLAFLSRLPFEIDRRLREALFGSDRAVHFQMSSWGIAPRRIISPVVQRRWLWLRTNGFPSPEMGCLPAGTCGLSQDAPLRHARRQSDYEPSVKPFRRSAAALFGSFRVSHIRITGDSQLKSTGKRRSITDKENGTVMHHRCSPRQFNRMSRPGLSPVESVCSVVGLRVDSYASFRCINCRGDNHLAEGTHTSGLRNSGTLCAH